MAGVDCFACHVVDVDFCGRVSVETDFLAYNRYKDAGEDQDDAADGIGDGITDGGDGAVEVVLDGPKSSHGIAATGYTAKGYGSREAE